MRLYPILPFVGPTRDGEEDALAVYLREMGQTPLLTAQEERFLVERMQAGDATARDQLARANARLVVRIARGYARGRDELIELIQEGNLGLLRALDRFDLARGYRLSTYAYWWIEQAIRRALERYVNGLHLPVGVQQAARDLKQTQAALWEREGREPREEDLAETLGVQIEQVRRLQAATRALLSLDEPLYGEGEQGSLAEQLSDDGPSVEEQAEQVLRAEALRAMMRQILTLREYLVLQLRYGLEQRPCASLAQIGELLGLTRERVRQIESQARHKLAHSPQVRALYQSKETSRRM